MKLKHLVIAAISTTLMAGASIAVLAADNPTVVVPNGELKWKELGVPGLAAAPVSGDMAKGPSRFFLKYPVGLVTQITIIPLITMSRSSRARSF